MKKTIIAIIALGATLSVAAQTTSSSNSTTAKTKGSKTIKTTSCSLKVGDKVYVDRANERYLTGERISRWVYDTVMTVQQIGTKRFPEGILLAPITSWVAGAAVGAEFYPIIPVSEQTQQTDQGQVQEQQSAPLQSPQEKQPTQPQQSQKQTQQQVQGLQPAQPEQQNRNQKQEPKVQGQEHKPAQTSVQSQPSQTQSQKQSQGGVSVVVSSEKGVADAQTANQIQATQLPNQPAQAEQTLSSDQSVSKPAEVQSQSQDVTYRPVVEEATIQPEELVAEKESEVNSEAEPDPELEPDLNSTKRVGEHRFGVGVKVGIADLFQTVGSSVLIDKRRVGFGGGLDLEYTYLSAVLSPNLFQMGVKTGVSLAYGGNSLLADEVQNSYSRADNDGRALLYTVEAKNICEKDNQLMVQIPLMFALRSSKGLYFAVGPKFSLPVSAWYNISYTNPNIDCYFVDYDVHETNQLVTGKLTGVAPLADNKLRTAKFNILIGGEIGYEFDFQGGSHLGILGYCDYSLYAPYPYEQVSTTGFIQVDGPKAGGANIHSVSLMNVVGNGMSYLSSGIKLVYSFNLNKSQEVIVTEDTTQK